MSEITDLVMPVLHSLQAQLGVIKRDLAEVKSLQAQQGTKLDGLKIHLADLTGTRPQNGST